MFHFFKKFSFIFLLGGLLLMGGLGCKGLSPEERAATLPVTLEYWTVFDDVDAIQALVEQYRSERPYLMVNIRQLRIDEFYPRLLEALAEDHGPDIVSIRNRALGGYLSKLAPMPPTFNDTTVIITKGTLNTKTIVNKVERLGMTPEQIEREYVQAVKKDVTRDGKIYGLPLSLDTLALYYNKDLLDRAGIAEPPKTWEEFQADVRKLTRYDKKTSRVTQAGAALGTGANVPGADDLLFILFRQSLVPFINTGGQVVFNTAARQDNSAGSAVERIMDFYTDFANPGRDTYSWNEKMENALESFSHGSLAFFFGYSYHAAQIRTRAPQLNFAIAPMIQLNPESPVNAANYWVQTVTNKSKHQDEAWGLVSYLAHSAATRDYLERTARPSALRVYLEGQKEKPELAPFAGQALVAENWYGGKNYDAALKAINDLFHEWLLPPPDENRLNEWRQEILNRATEKINQTL